MGKKYRVRVKSMNADGSGIVEFNNHKFSLRGVLPGELVTMELIYQTGEKKAKNLESAQINKARLCEILEPSKDRVEPACPNYGICGGCQLLHMNEEAQRKYKQKICEDLLGRFGKVSPIVAAEHLWHYRNKVHAAFSYAGDAAKHKNVQNKNIAVSEKYGTTESLKTPGSIDRAGYSVNQKNVKNRNQKKKIVSGIFEENSHRVVPTEDCLLQEKKAAEYLRTVRTLMEQTKTAPYQEDSGAGTLRYVFLRFAKATGQVLMVLVTGTDIFPAKARFAEEIKKKHPEIVTLLHNVNPAKNSMVLGKKETVLYGTGTIEDVLCGCKFRISATSFYQVNPEQTAVLYETAICLAELSKEMTVLDAYCGIGTISLIAAKSAGRVIGVELNKKAVEDAKYNARLNDCKNAEFICADAGEYMESAAARGESLDVVFLDPPRAGSDEKFLSSLLKAAPKKIIYISCNPETLARDLAYLTKNGYHAEEICPVDLFPGTRHCECIVRIIRERHEKERKLY